MCRDGDISSCVFQRSDEEEPSDARAAALKALTAAAVQAFRSRDLTQALIARLHKTLRLARPSALTLPKSDL